MVFGSGMGGCRNCCKYGSVVLSIAASPPFDADIRGCDVCRCSDPPLLGMTIFSRVTIPAREKAGFCELVRVASDSQALGVAAVLDGGQWIANFLSRTEA